MHIHESSEDYLEAILRLRETKGQVRSVDIAQLLGVIAQSASLGGNNDEAGLGGASLGGLEGDKIDSASLQGSDMGFVIAGDDRDGFAIFIADLDLHVGLKMRRLNGGKHGGNIGGKMGIGGETHGDKTEDDRDDR